MPTPAHSIIFWAVPYGTNAVINPGDVMIPDATATTQLVATTANRGTRRSEGVALTAFGGIGTGTVEIQSTSTIDASISGLGAGSASWVRCSATGRPERFTPSPGGTGDIIGRCEADGRLHLIMGCLTEDFALASGTLTSVTGTGLWHNTTGALDAAAYPPTAQYDILMSNATPDWVRFAKGSNSTVFQVSSGGVVSYSTILNAHVDAAAAIAYSKLGTGTQSIGAQQYDSTVDSKGTERTVEPKHVQTTDATVTTLDSFTLASGTAVIWTAVITAINTTGSQAAMYVRTAGFRNNAGTVSQVGATQASVTLEDDVAWDATIDFTGTTPRIRVTGKAATTLQWSCTSQRVEVIP